jgi:hypothetical protein
MPNLSGRISSILRAFITAVCALGIGAGGVVAADCNGQVPSHDVVFVGWGDGENEACASGWPGMGGKCGALALFEDVWTCVTATENDGCLPNEADERHLFYAETACFDGECWYNVGSIVVVEKYGAGHVNSLHIGCF